jgi:hypothetical protein
MNLERIYLDLRENAFKYQLDNNVPPENSMVKALIMDWHLGNGIMTLACFGTGEASLYLSSGGGKIGGSDDTIKEWSHSLIITSNEYIELAEKRDSHDLPDDDHINFFLLSQNDKLLIKESMVNIRQNSSQVMRLFEISNLIIGKLMQSE